MSCADLVHHLIEADRWLFKKLRVPELSGMAGKTGEAGHVDRATYFDLLAELERIGEDRAELLFRLTDGELAVIVPDNRFGGKVEIWWVIVRGNLDHETHHRGQLAAYLRMVTSQDHGDAG